MKRWLLLFLLLPLFALGQTPTSPVGPKQNQSYLDNVGALWFFVNNTWFPLGAGFNNPMTTAGDIITGGASGIPTRLGIGSSNAILSVNTAGTGLEYRLLATTGGIGGGYATGLISLYLQESVITATDANITTINPGRLYKLPQITANRTIDVSNPGSFTGQKVTFWNQNTSGNTWTFTGATVVNSAGVSTLTIPSASIVSIESDGGQWIATVTPNTSTNIYNSDGALTGTRTLDLNGQFLVFNDATTPSAQTGTFVFSKGGMSATASDASNSSGSQLQLDASQIDLSQSPSGTLNVQMQMGNGNVNIFTDSVSSGTLHRSISILQNTAQAGIQFSDQSGKPAFYSNIDTSKIFANKRSIPSTGWVLGRIKNYGGGSGGTVTNIATSTGITGGPITTTGTLKADTSVLQTVLNFFPKGDTRYAKISQLPAGANPTATLGLTAVNGSATTFLRSDGAPALSQTITPTMTGLWIYAVNNTASSGNNFGFEITPTVNQTSTAAFTDLLVNRTQTAVGSGTQRLFDFQVGGSSKANLDNNGNMSIGNNLVIGNSISANTIGSLSNSTALAVQNSRTISTAMSNMTILASSSITNSTGTVIGVAMTPTINQTSTAAFTDFDINNTETVLGSGAQLFANFRVAGTSKFSVDHTGVINSAALTASKPIFTDASKNFTSTGPGTTSQFIDGTGALQTYTAGTTGANPSASLGLTAINGSATTYMRSDGAPALSQSITPTWTGLHTWAESTTSTTVVPLTALINTSVSNASSNLYGPAIDFQTRLFNASTDKALDFYIKPHANSSTTVGELLFTSLLAGGSETQLLSIDRFGNFNANGAFSALTNYNLRGSSSGVVTLASQAAAGTYNFNLPTTAGTAGQVLTSQGGGATAMTWSSTPVIQATADLTAQTAAVTVGTFTVGASTATFSLSGYINITAVTVDVIELQATYTDENSTSQTANFFTQGATSALLSAIGNSAYPPMTIRAKNGTVITIKTTLTTGTGSIAYDAGARIQQL